MQAEACETILDEGPATQASQRALLRRLNALTRGDEVFVHTLDAFQLTTGELSLLLRRFFETGVTIRFVGASSPGDALAPTPVVPKALVLLAEHEVRRQSLLAAYQPSPTQRRTLTRYQMDYARNMRRLGKSLREIGLLFQMTPNELSDLIGR
jgi:hypothetical protein